MSEAARETLANASVDVEKDDGFERSFRRRHPLLWFSTLIGPFAMTAMVLLALSVVVSPDYVKELLVAATFTFFFFGRFVILGGQQFLSPEQLVLMVLYMDLMTAMLLAFHTGFLFRLPWVGKKLRELVDDGQFILESNPWMRRMTFVGIVAFVMFPLAATGSIGGSIFGRLLGMSRLLTFTGVLTGSLLGCGLMYFGASLVEKYIHRDDPWFTVSGIAFVVLLILLLNQRYRRMKAMRRAAHA